MSPENPRRSSPAAQRNYRPIHDVLAAVLPERGLVLEVASGSGEHVRSFAADFPQLTWQPSDPDPHALGSIAARVADSGLANLKPPFALDVTAGSWPIAQADAILCINMVHISPWAATEALLRGAAAVLPDGGLLYLYGPYRRAGTPTSPSNEAFDADLRHRNPAWGLRDLDAVEEEARLAGLRLFQVVEMPANNLSLLLRATGVRA